MKSAEPTTAEAELLRLVLREVRHAVATKQQLQVIVDPWVAGGGTNVCFAFNGSGWSREVVGKFPAKIARRGRTS